MKNGVNKSAELELPPRPALSRGAKVVAGAIAGLLGVVGFCLALQHGCGARPLPPSCPDGQVYSGDIGRCVTPE